MREELTTNCAASQMSTVLDLGLYVVRTVVIRPTQSQLLNRVTALLARLFTRLRGLAITVRVIVQLQEPPMLSQYLRGLRLGFSNVLTFVDHARIWCAQLLAMEQLGMSAILWRHHSVWILAQSLLLRRSVLC